MRSFRNIIYGALLALATAGPGMAETWTGPNNTGIQVFKVGNSTDQFLVYFGYEAISGRPVWQGATAPISTTHFDAKTFIARNGQPLGGTYRSPVLTENYDDISVRWFTATDGDYVDFPRAELGTLRLSTDPTQALTRTLIETGRPIPNPAKGYHPNGWWWEPSASGTGIGTDIQGDTLFATIFTYDATGLDDWYFTTGAMTSNALYSGSLQHCSKATGTVVCSSVGTINLTFFYVNSAAPDSHRINVVLPSGSTMTLQKYAR